MALIKLNVLMNLIYQLEGSHWLLLIACPHEGRGWVMWVKWSYSHVVSIRKNKAIKQAVFLLATSDIQKWLNNNNNNTRILEFFPKGKRLSTLGFKSIHLGTKPVTACRSALIFASIQCSAYLVYLLTKLILDTRNLPSLKEAKPM